MKYDIRTFEEGSFVVVKHKEFWDWVRVRLGMSKEEVFRCNKDRKKKIFLRWRWGRDLDGNIALEATEHNIICNMLSPERLAKMNRRDREFFRGQLQYEKKCNKYRQELGLPIWKIPCLTD